jgi:hypothetical protein
MYKIKNKRQMKILGFKHIIKLTCVSLFSLGVLSCNTGPKTQDITLSYLIEDNNMHYERISGAVLLGENPQMKVYAKVTNTSDYGGVFKFYAKLSSLGNTIEFNKEQYIGSGETVEFKEVNDINPYSFETNVEVVDWGIIPPTKTIQLK